MVNTAAPPQPVARHWGERAFQLSLLADELAETEWRDFLLGLATDLEALAKRIERGVISGLWPIRYSAFYGR